MHCILHAITDHQIGEETVIGDLRTGQGVVLIVVNTVNNNRSSNRNSSRIQFSQQLSYQTREQPLTATTIFSGTTLPQRLAKRFNSTVKSVT